MIAKKLCLSSMFIATCIFLTFILFCTEPVEPGYKAVFKNEKQIRTLGKSIIDSTLYLYVIADGTPPLSYQWTKNKIGINNNRDTLQYSKVDTNITGIYQCIVSNEFGHDTSSIYTLTVFIPPVIISHPQNKKLVEGDSTAFSIQVRGTMPLIYQWEKNSSPINGATDSVFNTSIVTVVDSASQYRCVVSNNYGSITSNVAILTVYKKYEKPTVLSNPKNVTIKVGDSTTFSISAKGSSPLAFQWQKNNSNIISANDSIYITPRLSKTDSGSLYRCIVSNDSGRDTSDMAILSVIEHAVKPEILREPQSIEILVGDSATFAVSATGTGVMNFQWQKNDTAIVNTNDSIYTTPTALLEDSGSHFRCIVSNNVGSDTSVYAILSVSQIAVKPVITKQPRDTTLFVGDSALFSLLATGTTPLQFNWLRNDTIIPNANSNTYITPSLLMIDNGAQFQCIVSNSVGVDTSAIALLSVTQNIIKPTITVEPQNQSVTIGDSASFSVTVSGTAPFTYQWQKNNSNIANATGISYTTSQTVLTDSGSTFRCLVSNSAGADTSINAILSVNPNKPPVIDNAPSVDAVEDNTNQYPINISGHDPEGEAVRWYVDKLPSKGTLNKLEGDLTAGIEMLYTLKSDSCGKDSLTFFLMDPINNSSDTQAIQISIDSVNDAPVITGQSMAVSCNEDNNCTISKTSLSITDIDNAPDDLSLLVLDSANYRVVSGTSIKPDTNYNGALAVKVKVVDDMDTSGVFVMNVTVNPVNDPPTIAMGSMPSSIDFGNSASISATFKDVENSIDSIFLLADYTVVGMQKVNGADTLFTFSWTPVFGPRVIRKHYMSVIAKDNEGASDTAGGTSSIDVLGTYVSDSLSTQAILDTNGCWKAVSEVSKTNLDGRIDTLLFYDGGIQYPRFVKIPLEIENLTALNSFTIWNNEIQSMPRSICNVTSLKILILLDGTLISIDENISKLVNIEELSFRNNQLTDLPAGIVNLINVGVDKLDLSGNKLPTNANPPEPWEDWATVRDPDWRTTQQTK